jgi:hypothetical protein
VSAATEAMPTLAGQTVSIRAMAICVNPLLLLLLLLLWQAVI